MSARSQSNPRNRRLRSRAVAATVLALLFSLSTAVYAQGNPSQGNPPPFPSIPAPAPIGAETHRVYADRIEVVGGQTIWPVGGDLQFILATCLRDHAKPPEYPNPVIGIYEDIATNVGTVTQQMQFGGGDAGQRTYRADWGQNTPMNFTVIGMDPDSAKIPGFLVTDKLSGTTWGGIGTVRFEALRIESQGATCVQTSQEMTTGGSILVYNCLFLKDPHLDQGVFGGYKIKWGIRGHGPVRWDIRGGIFVPLQEHCIYIDSPQGDSYIQDTTHVESGNTAIQVVNRPFNCPLPPDHEACVEDYVSGATPYRPTGFGKLLIYGTAIGNLTGVMGGGFGVTVAGHKDDVWIKDITHVNAAQQQGSVVAWVDSTPSMGAHLFTPVASSQLYAIQRVVLKNITVNVSTQAKNATELSAVGKLQVVYPWSVSTNRTAFALDTQAGIGNFAQDQGVVIDGIVQRLNQALIVQNRDSFFYWLDANDDLSAYPGFHGPGAKISEDGVVLTDQAIDARWPSPGVNNP